MRVMGIGALVLVGALLGAAWKFEKWPFGPAWIQVRSDAGAPVLGSWVLFRNPYGTSVRIGVTRGDGWIRIRRNWYRKSDSFAAVGPGHRMIEGPLPENGELVLPAAPRVVFRLDDSIPEPGALRVLGLTLLPLDVGPDIAEMVRDSVTGFDANEAFGFLREPEFEFDRDSRSVVLRIPRAGRWRALVFEEFGVIRSRHTHRVRTELFQVEFELGPDDTEMTFSVDPATIERLRERWQGE